MDVEFSDGPNCKGNKSLSSNLAPAKMASSVNIYNFTNGKVFEPDLSSNYNIVKFYDGEVFLLLKKNQVDEMPIDTASILKLIKGQNEDQASYKESLEKLAKETD